MGGDVIRADAAPGPTAISRRFYAKVIGESRAFVAEFEFITVLR